MRVIVAGDFAPIERINELVNGGGGETLLSPVQSLIQQADYSIVNLEAPLETTRSEKIQKSGPHLSSSEESILLLKKTGFKCCSLANNHLRDLGDNGVFDTMNYLDSCELDHVGCGDDLKSAAKVLIKTIKGERIAIIAACEQEFSIAEENKPGANPLDVVVIADAIRKTKPHVDYLLLIVHGGHEFYQYPSPRMKKLYRFFVEMGADAVVNHHQHCFSGYEVYEGKPIFYGLGNFCFDRAGKRNSIWNEGYLVQLDFGEVIQFKLYPYIQCNEKPTVEYSDEDVFQHKINIINEIINDDTLLKNKFSEFVIEKKKKNVLSILSPYLTDYARIAAGHHLLPYFLPKSKIRAILNYIKCEAHFDETELVLKDYLNE